MEKKLNNKIITPVIVAAGKATRMGFNKQLIKIAGIPAILYSYNEFCRAGFKNIIVVTDDPEKYRAILPDTILCKGGETRQESVRAALQFVPENTDFIAIHDGARPMVTAEKINEVIEDAIYFGNAILAVPVIDTIKSARALVVKATLDRNMLYQVQTPQVFAFKTFKNAFENATSNDFTDDSQLMEAIGETVHITQDFRENFKLTTPDDVIMADAILSERRGIKSVFVFEEFDPEKDKIPNIDEIYSYNIKSERQKIQNFGEVDSENIKSEELKRQNFDDFKPQNIKGENSEIQNMNTNNIKIGQGYDVHRLTENRKLILGGVEIPYERGLLGHSDADVLTHAIMDAILGAAGMGDIGRHFPDTDERFKGANSLELLRHVVEICDHKIGNIDATVIAQAPKLASYIPQMKANLEAICHAPVNIKATTEEGLGFTGNGEGIAAHAVALLFS